RTDTSSSTTNTTGVSREIASALDSLPASPGELMSPSRVEIRPTKRGPDRIQQGRLAKRLEQALDGPAREQTRTVGPLSVGGDEHNWHCLPSTCLFLFMMVVGHRGHCELGEELVCFTSR